jgi:hypothetical protein
LLNAANRKLVKNFLAVPGTEKVHQPRGTAQQLQNAAAVDALARRIFLDFGYTMDFAWNKLVQEEDPLPCGIQTEN